jgi:hypothetical protein
MWLCAGAYVTAFMGMTERPCLLRWVRAWDNYLRGAFLWHGTEYSC